MSDDSTLAVALSAPVRWALLLLALLCLALALIGVVVPGLPTTVFLIVAAWAAARSSPALHRWLWGHRIFGPLLQQWERGILPRNAKWTASASMAFASVILMATLSHRPLVVTACILCMACVSGWLWSKPEQ